jgi:hypothetical protein
MLQLGILKESGLLDTWDRFRGLFAPKSHAEEDVKEHFSTDGKDRWDKFVQRASSSDEFVTQLAQNKKADAKLVAHAKALRDLHKGSVLGDVESGTEQGKKYQIKQMGDGRVGCTCSDWRYRGSVDPSYQCKHVRAYQEGKMKVASFNQVTAAFFDELRKIRQHEASLVEKARGADPDIPSDGQLTTNEDRSEYNARPAPLPDEPEVILGGLR